MTARYRKIRGAAAAAAVVVAENQSWPIKAIVAVGIPLCGRRATGFATYLENSPPHGKNLSVACTYMYVSAGFLLGKKNPVPGRAGK